MNELFDFQHSGVEFLVSRKRALLASDPGTGKTIMLIAAVTDIIGREVFGTARSFKVLVLCPKSVRLNWEREIKKWCPFDCAPGIWTVTNWDTILTKKGASLLGRKWDIVIADESHCAIKNPKAKRCKVFLDKIVPNAGRVWLATATPASKSGLDYFCTLKVLIPQWARQFTTDRAFAKSFCEEKYCAFAPGNRKYEGFKNKDVLRTIFKKVCIRHKKEDVLKDLPKKLYTDLEVEVPADIVAMHMDLDEGVVAGLIAKGSPLPGHVAIVMQATAHAKLDMACEWIENFPEDESLVVFAWHRSIVEELHERIPESEMIMGSTGEKERQIIVDKFQRGDVKRLICNMVAGGVGINLQRSRTALYVEFPFSPSYLVQSENRIHRIGSTGSHVHIVRMVGKGTIDEAIWHVLQERMKAIEEVGV